MDGGCQNPLFLEVQPARSTRARRVVRRGGEGWVPHRAVGPQLGGQLLVEQRRERREETTPYGAEKRAGSRASRGKKKAHRRRLLPRVRSWDRERNDGRCTAGKSPQISRGTGSPGSSMASSPERVGDALRSTKFGQRLPLAGPQIWDSAHAPKTRRSSVSVPARQRSGRRLGALRRRPG